MSANQKPRFISHQQIRITGHSAHMTSLLLTTDPAPPDALLSRGFNSDLAKILVLSSYSGLSVSLLYLLLLPTRSPSVSLMGSSRPETLSKSRFILRMMITEGGNRCTVNRKLRNSVELNAITVTSLVVYLTPPWPRQQ